MNRRLQRLTFPFRYRRAHRAIIAVALVLVTICYAGALQMTGNFHSVIAGTLYRSGQLSPDRLTEVANRHGIRTVINLRGPNAGRDWYDLEVEAAKSLGIAHVDFRMSAGEMLSPARAAMLIALMDGAEKPLLIHCKAGADRTGLASALYLAAIAGTQKSRARAQLSFAYGHLTIPVFNPARAMDVTFAEIAPDLLPDG